MVKMTEAGMDPFDILASGTVNVGRYFHEDFGTIAAGQRADLVLVDANPLDDVANAAKRSGVMLNGRWIPESEIQMRLQQIARANEGAPAAPQ
jgi:imidazolonepropionase-like amidohydrolase